jgi:hypothetical protein
MSLNVKAVKGTVASTDASGRPVQFHFSVELPHVAHPLSDLPGLYVSPYRQPFTLAPLPRMCTLLLAEDNNHHNTLWCPVCYNFIIRNRKKNQGSKQVNTLATHIWIHGCFRDSSKCMALSGASLDIPQAL